MNQGETVYLLGDDGAIAGTCSNGERWILKCDSVIHVGSNGEVITFGPGYLNIRDACEKPRTTSDDEIMKAFDEVF